ncbi:GLPGLI family protein [Pedobacter sp. HMF7647]|uniref:GLPGLI family protein n=1 Tax=Hufsiella arboris TaxID=2695275 RepID=A0A7K1YE85_9SPHI|nr:GLPGLI family protein [Hufsiella arboris]MXV52892.1 GLPGLI family protein [Hufsiella arboris]
MKATILTIAALLMLARAFAQNIHFVTSGQITYEKKVNMYALLNKRANNENGSWMQQIIDDYKKNQPQFKTMKSTLNFSGDQTLFTPETTTETGGFFIGDPAATQPNVIYSDMNAQSSTSQKKVYEELFLVKDSIRKINWKITSETREIAGYSCRRANAVIMDSVYVVAFYTDLIPLSGGPESFNGLPGMILGVALPHENVSWFATAVTDRSITANEMKPPVKGKASNRKDFINTLQSALKNWGSYAQTALKAYLL